jgi:hypothetical protein
MGIFSFVLASYLQICCRLELPHPKGASVSFDKKGLQILKRITLKKAFSNRDESGGK